MSKNPAKEKDRKKKILRSLLENPKTTGELAKDLGYFENGIPKYNAINTLLKDLENKGYIESKEEKKNTPGAPPTRYFIKYNIKNLKRILDDDPDLTLKINKDELVLNSIFEVTTITKPFFNPETGDRGVYAFPITEEFKENMKEKMRLSPAYFRFCLNKYNKDHRERIIELAEFTERLEGKNTKEVNELFIDSWKSHFNEECPEIATFGDKAAIKVCVFYDILNGQSSEEAKEYLLRSG